MPPVGDWRIEADKLKAERDEKRRADDERRRFNMEQSRAERERRKAEREERRRADRERNEEDCELELEKAQTRTEELKRKLSEAKENCGSGDDGDGSRRTRRSHGSKRGIVVMPPGTGFSTGYPQIAQYPGVACGVAACHGCAKVMLGGVGLEMFTDADGGWVDDTTRALDELMRDVTSAPSGDAALRPWKMQVYADRLSAIASKIDRGTMTGRNLRTYGASYVLISAVVLACIELVGQ